MKSRSNIWFFVLLLLLPLSLMAAPSMLSDIVKEVLRAEGNKEPITVQAGVRIHQITKVDQKHENFGIVGTIFLYWKDPQLSETLLEDGQQYRSFSSDAFNKLADKHQIKIPRYSIYNQQGKRHMQNAGWSVFKGGENIHFERFSVTLQAPDFNFQQYPFDSQNFFIHLDLLLPDAFFIFEVMDNYSGMGDKLGEEEWVIIDTSSETSVTTESTGLENSRYSFGFTAKRHVNFYMIRIFLPILVITLVSWITFFLNDFRKRIDMASGNLLIFIAFNFSISGNLPKLGYLTFMDSFMFIAFILTSFIILLNVVFRRMELSGHVQIAHNIDSYLIWLYPGAIIAGLYWLSSTYLDNPWFF